MSNPIPAAAKGLPKLRSEQTSAIKLALGSLATAKNYLHAAWMAARSLDGDASAEGEALQTVIHMAGECLSDVRAALRKAGVEGGAK
jgi:hypothetical protein